jgi:predicted permease
MGGYAAPLFFEIEGRGAGAARTTMHSFQVTPGYFDTMGIRVVRGRGITEGDRADSQPVVVISEAAARAFFGGQDPLTQRIRLSADLPWMPIVGVVSDVQNRRLTEPAQPIFYQPLEQSPSLTVAMLVRTRGPQPAMAESLAGAVRAVDRNVPIYAVRTMNEFLATAVAQRRFLMRFVLAFGGAAIALALLGLYGVISYSVARRTREIGIRVAVGARQLDIARLVVGQGLRLAAAGLAIGVIAAFGLTRFIQAQLYGVQRFDPLTFGGVFLVVIVAALAAVLLPASRAARVDPIVALRSEG